MVDREKAARLRQARERSGFRSAAKAAAALRVPYATYAGQENGTRGFGREYVERYAARFGVDPRWLEFGAPENAPAPVQQHAVEPTEVIERLIQERDEAQRRFTEEEGRAANAREILTQAQEAMREAGLKVSTLTVALDRLRPRGR